jgi:hypothetical protein
MSNPLPLLSTCPQCRGAVAVSFEYWRPGLIAHDAAWACPHCLATVKLGVIGRVVSVAKRDAPRVS